MPFSCRRFARSLPMIGVIAGALVTVLSSGSPARAQVAIIVNGDPITVYDIDQRTKLMNLSGQKGATRQQAIEDLIGDKLKLSAAKGYKLEITKSDVDNSFGNIARNVRATPESFAKTLERAGINPDTLQARLKADL